MNYFKNTNNQIFAYDDQQVAQGYGKDLQPITEQEALAIANPPPTEKQLAEQRIAELQQKLRESDYVTLSDYDQDKPELIAQRQAWREEIRQLEELL